MLREGDDDPEGSVEVVAVNEESRILLQTKNKIVFGKSEKEKIKEYSHTLFEFSLELQDNTIFFSFNRTFFPLLRFWVFYYTGKLCYYTMCHGFGQAQLG